MLGGGEQNCNANLGSRARHTANGERLINNWFVWTATYANKSNQKRFGNNIVHFYVFMFFFFSVHKFNCFVFLRKMKRTTLFSQTLCTDSLKSSRKQETGQLNGHVFNRKEIKNRGRMKGDKRVGVVPSFKPGRETQHAEALWQKGFASL